ncbi:hypothetical protein EB118_13735 [bacterium]|nr:hypothetical protein [bacterium]
MRTLLVPYLSISFYCVAQITSTKTNVTNEINGINVTNGMNGINVNIDINRFYDCFTKCATSNQIDITQLDNKDKICEALTSKNKNFINFMKCNVENCKIEINGDNTPSTTQNPSDTQFNCPGFDPAIFTDTVVSNEAIHSYNLPLLFLMSFLLFL